MDIPQAVAAFSRSNTEILWEAYILGGDLTASFSLIMSEFKSRFD